MHDTSSDTGVAGDGLSKPPLARIESGNALPDDTPVNSPWLSTRNNSSIDAAIKAEGGMLAQLGLPNTGSPLAAARTRPHSKTANNNTSSSSMSSKPRVFAPMHVEGIQQAVPAEADWRELKHIPASFTELVHSDNEGGEEDEDAANESKASHPASPLYQQQHQQTPVTPQTPARRSQHAVTPGSTVKFTRGRKVTIVGQQSKPASTTPATPAAPPTPSSTRSARHSRRRLRRSQLLLRVRVPACAMLNTSALLTTSRDAHPPPSLPSAEYASTAGHSRLGA